ncbi:GNAT family N-acetyltransferase [Crocosphaera chwakensis]|uniref:N-acetyltransferase domain-containing protein n=1 Tax=Crocosphaera chwakensis CCY0110 TaxID=391612 RepID=A3IM07_9CHRO|nr:GNAT family N-acetyltransferase [Crocosphaera chwakensis]EAZ92463.1 hypothetical protein CY0110_02019 [Crocosphaera chwakensis CCY0110]
MIELPRGYCLRQATSQNIWIIRWLVLREFLDPTQLRPEQFWIIELDRQIIACGQLRTFAQAQELGSIVVQKSYRNQGLGTYLTEHLIKISHYPLYLECLGDQLKDFYQRLGFVEVDFDTISSSLQQKFRVTSTIAKWFRLPLYIMVLKKDE